MAIIATFTDGLTGVKVHGLTQWDFGQTLELRDPTLPAVIEVHFAFPGLTEAIKRSCSAVSGVASVAIPDACLEQSAPVMAWVYEVGATSGRTIRTVVLPIEQRKRPAPYEDIPVEVSNLYTEAVAAMEQAVAEVRAGSVPMVRAALADQATLATADSEGKHIASTYASFTGPWVEASALPGAGVYLVKFLNYQCLVEWDGVSRVTLPTLSYFGSESASLFNYALKSDGGVHETKAYIYPLNSSNTEWTFTESDLDSFQYKWVSGLTSETVATVAVYDDEVTIERA